MNAQLSASLKLRLCVAYALVVLKQIYTNIASSLRLLYPYIPTEGCLSIWFRTLSAHPRALFKFIIIIILLAAIELLLGGSTDKTSRFHLFTGHEGP
jgi:hypothetical protein